LIEESLAGNPGSPLRHMAHSAFQGGHRPVGRRILALVC
jgi:hypothetical protein